MGLVQGEARERMSRRANRIHRQCRCCTCRTLHMGLRKALMQLRLPLVTAAAAADEETLEEPSLQNILLQVFVTKKECRWKGERRQCKQKKKCRSTTKGPAQKLVDIVCEALCTFVSWCLRVQVRVYQMPSGQAPRAGSLRPYTCCPQHLLR